MDRNRLARRIGRRGLLLVIAGMAWVFAGTSIIVEPVERFSHPGEGTDHLLQFLDGPWFAVAWIACGAIALFTGVTRNRNNPDDERDVIGYNAILLPPLLWALFFLWSWGAFLGTHGREGRITGITAAIVYGLVCVFVFVVAGWPEPRAIRELREESDRKDDHP